MGAHEVLFPPTPYSFKPRADAATHDAALQKAVLEATWIKDTKRRASFADAFGPRVDDVRKLAAAIKQHTLDHLDVYLERFVERAEAAGVQVHFAKDAAQASAVVVEIAKRRGLKRCVKAKSMATEEVALVPALQAAGVEAVETDLAEFILQIDDDAPSHIVTAMIHKDRRATGRAMHRVLGVPYTEDPPTLTRIAREHLRGKYRAADLGVAGGNFLVAETGSLVLCTNEGNGRMCTTLPAASPGVHVAVVGIEKLVPSMEHLAVMLKVLARSSTAQPLTVYTQVITGPRRPGEVDGPGEVHVVLLDNGRTGVLAGDGREMLRCIRCGACLNTCPVYRKIGGHAYGSVYSGPIGAILTPHLRGLEQYPDLPHASTLCGACYEVCPVRINIPQHLTRLRGEAVAQGHETRAQRATFRAWAAVLRRPWLYRVVNRLQRTALRMRGGAKWGDGYDDRAWVKDMPGARGWTDVRDLPTPTSRSFRDWWERRDV